MRIGGGSRGFMVSQTRVSGLSFGISYLAYMISQHALVIAGDFNEILEQSEKKGGPLRAEWQIRNFWNCLTYCELHDMGFLGSPYTWCNNQREPLTMYERLDRVCSTAAWAQAFSEAQVRHLPSPNSVHSALLIELRPTIKWEPSGSRRCFRFEAAWVQKSRCEDIITKDWDRPGSLEEKLECLGARLSVWGRLVLRETKDRIARLEQELVSLKGGALTAANHTRLYETERNTPN
ncbi:UNVERIFIED_CONTAM: hypothetical protein Sangu_2313500 [Sesamum angustifolium]|uniref:Endonuclease/exonuclease/phosphatase domain-containing protein n=1 Tax=Sesamum angustifolium TaxID=2727405 RepID=A0AAW2L949_9LAMI